MGPKTLIRKGPYVRAFGRSGSGVRKFGFGVAVLFVRDLGLHRDAPLNPRP